MRLQVVDLRELVSTSAGSFDLIWAGDLFWPGNFSDPAAMIADTVGALAPGARLAVYTSNYYQSTFLPGQPSYVVDEPGFYVMHPALVITGRRPR